MYVCDLKTVKPGNLLFAWEGKIEQIADPDTSDDNSNDSDPPPSPLARPELIIHFTLPIIQIFYSRFFSL